MGRMGLLIFAGLIASPAAAQDAAEAKTCTALVMPSVIGAQGSAADMAAPVRDLFASYLTGPTLRALPLEARLASQAMEEAKQKGCGRVLMVKLTLKSKNGSGNSVGRAVGQAAGTAAYYIPGGGVGGAVARGTAAATASAVSSIASSTHEKDELTIEYTLSTTEGRTLLTRSDKAKAQANGEDLVTPLVERAATAIAAAPTK
jgi:hypothetical protein